MEPIIEEQSVEEVNPENSDKKKRRFRIVILVVVIGLLVVACTLLTELFIRPLAEPLFIREGTATPTLIAVEPTDDQDVGQPTDAMEPTEIEPSACTETGTMSFL
ncbi:MAG TPA: hypothetical protein VJ965_03195, partial [Anaerolineales bacterium]|nr:hypothetical protein [Anaerolineales bacterium]